MAERIQGLSIGLDLDSMGVERSLSEIKRSFRGLDSSIRTNVNNMKYGEKSMSNYESTVTSLNEDITKQRKNLDDLGNKHAEAVREQGANSKAATRLATEYNKQADNLNYLERQLEGVTKEMKEFEKSQSGWGKMSTQLDQYSQSLTGIGDKMSDFGGKMTATVTVPALAAGGAFLKQASDVESSQARVQNALGLTANEAERVAGVARDVYADGWGESFEQVEESIIQVGQQLDILDDPAQLQDITVKALELERVFGMDMSETLRGVNALMESYGLTAAESMDYITVGAQNGLNKTDELGDNLAEYAPLFEENGYSAQEMFDILEAGLDAGAYNLDKVNDLVKEFGIRVGDGTIRDAVAELGGEWQSIYETWEASGEANDVLFQKLAQNLASIEDPQEKQLALTEIWGSMGEDAGFKVIEAMGKVEGKYNDVNGATEKMVETTEKTFGQRFQSLLREAAAAFLPLGEALLEIGEDYLPVVSDWVGRLSTGLQNMDEDTLNAGLKIVGLTAVIGPLVKVGGSLAGAFSNIAGVLSKVTGWIAGKGGLTAVLTGKGGLTASLIGKGGLTAALGKAGSFLMGPWGLAIGAGITASLGLYDHLTEEAIPATGQYGDKVSETTQSAMNDFNQLHETAVQEMTLLFAESGPITEEGTEQLRQAFTGMYEQIKTASEENREENVGNIQQLFAESGTTIDEGEQVILGKLNGHYDNRNQQLQNMYDRQQEILRIEAEEERRLTEQEEQELMRLTNEMHNLGIESLSQSEQEQIAIKETMSQEKGAIDARTAADTVKRSNEAKNGVIQEAEERYEGVIASAAYERDVMGSISTEEADEIIAQATRGRDDTIRKAEERHNGVVKEAQEQAQEHVNEVDWETGEVLNNWEVMWNNLKSKNEEANREAEQRRKQFMDFLGIDIDEIVSWFEDLPNRISGAVAAGERGVRNAFASMMNGGLTAVQDVVNTITGGINTVLDWLGSDSQIDTWNPTPISYGSSPNAYAEGTDGHPGGPAFVGDGGMEELISTPDGNMYMSPNTDTLVDMPKGTQVLSGPDTKGLMRSLKVPGYASGIGDALSSFWGWVSDGASTLLNNTLDFIGVSPPTSDDGPGVFGDIAVGAFDTIKDAAVGFVQGKINDLFSFSGVSFPGLTMTSGFGPRSSPGGIGSTNHMGVDFAGPVGTPIPAQAGGLVTSSGWAGGLGNMVEITSGNTKYRYGHNSENLVDVGETVSPGQHIGLVGSTGNSTGPHVHFEIIHNGQHVDPMSFSGGMAGIPGAQGVQQWRGVAAQALGMTGQLTPTNLNALLNQMQTESGGNPQAINTWDINAMMGTPSKGLMQVIDPTFQAHAMPGYNNIWNPLDNILASIRYTLSRYGSLTAGWRGVGYATGGLVEEDGLYRLAEEGYPEFVIPTDPKRRTDAMKLLALAGKQIQGNSQRNKRPNQIPNTNETNVLGTDMSETNELLRTLIEMIGEGQYIDGKKVMDSLFPHADNIGGKNINQKGRGLA